MNKNILDTFPGMGNRQLPQNGDIVMSMAGDGLDRTITPLNNTDDEGRFFNGGHSLDDYDSIIVKDRKIVTIFSSKGGKKLSVGDFVQLKGDSKGYIGSGHGNQEWVTIKGFVEPFQGGHSDNIIQVVASDGKEGFIKPKNIIANVKKDYIRESLEGYNQNYIRGKNKEIDDIFDKLNIICYPYTCGITANGILELNTEMPDELKNQTRILAQRIVIAMQS